MVKTLRSLIKTYNMFMTDLSWSKARAENALLHELFQELLQYYQHKVTKRYNERLSHKIDCLQSILDEWR